MTDLMPGQRVPLNVGAQGGTIAIAMDGPKLGDLGEFLGAAVVALNGARTVPSDWPATCVTTRELRPGLVWGDHGALSIDIAAIPADVERLMLIPYIVGGMATGISFRDFQALTVTIGEHRFALDLQDRREAAMILIEIYRHNGAWRLAANSQGFVGGIGAAASALGIVIDVPQPDVPPRSPGGGYDDYRGPPPSGPSAGSGFAIDPHHIITNAHVVAGTSRIKVVNDRRTLEASCVFSDPHNDIAMLRVAETLESHATLRHGIDLHLGEDIVVLGYPLQGLLGSGLQVTAGNISALCGLGNDTGVMQFTAPIASGNSGGPILDHGGLVIGLVCSSLNKDRVRDGGGVAENVNFGVKAANLRVFLSVNAIEPAESPALPARSRTDIVKQARGFLYHVQCDG